MSGSVGFFDVEQAIRELRAWVNENKDEIHLLAELSRAKRKLAEFQNQKQQSTTTVEA